MRVHHREIEVFVSSHSEGNVYEQGERAPFGGGLYCEAVMTTRRELLVADARKDPEWNHNPDIELGMISYCGLPLTWPSGEVFGTVCMLDKKENPYSSQHRELLAFFRDSIQLSLQNIYEVNQSKELKKRAENLAKLAEKKYRALVENFPAVIYTASAYSEARGLFVSPQIESLLGLPLKDYQGERNIWLEQLHPEDRDRVLKNLSLAYESGMSLVSEYRLLNRQGDVIWVRDEATIVEGENGNPQYLLGVLINITESIKTLKELEASQQRFDLAVRGTSEGLWDWNPNTGEVWFAPRFKQLLGYEDHELSSSYDAWETRLHPEDHERVISEIQLYLDHGKLFDTECRLRTRENGYCWFRIRGRAIRDETGKPMRMAGSIQDITERKKIEGQLIYSALHDTLTGLPNRLLLIDRLRHAIKLGERQIEGRTAVLHLALDRFKVINESLGHHMGDQLLNQIAVRLQQCMRSGDTVARIGGDEFVMLIGQNCDLNTVLEITESVQQAVTHPINLGDNDIFITCSIGIVLPSEIYQKAEEQLRDADTAMYCAKSRGGNCIEVFEQKMRDGAVKRFSLERDLRHALEESQLQLHYQPIVSLENRRIVGLEALVRWYHPEKGIISPDDFIPVAEETSLIVQIGTWILEQACHFMRDCAHTFPHATDMYVSVNLSPRQIKQPNLYQDVNRILNEAKLNPKNLRLEITESLLMENNGAAQEQLPHLKALGIQLYMDDFGTGFSSLSYLHTFPLDVLKIDRSFIDKMSQDDRHMNLVGAIVSIARNYDMQIIAEGVETLEQAKMLKRIGCHYGQGYLYSKPLTQEKVRQTLQSVPSILPLPKGVEAQG